MADTEAPTGATPITDGLHHLRSYRDESGIVWLTLDRSDSRTNTLNSDVLTELSTAFDRVRAEKPRALVIQSGKEAGFIAGADIAQFRDMGDRQKAEEMIRSGQKVMDKLAGLGLPTVAAINGYCLGGGYELALACRYRVATDDARLGLPEVKLGIHPGFGGSARLTRLLPAPKALSVMLQGRTMSGRSAKKMGLVDDATRQRHLAEAARRFAGKRGPARRPGWWWRPILNAPGVRQAAAPIVRRATRKQVRDDHYPAPFALIDLWAKHGTRKAGMIKAEAKSVARLIVQPTAQNLVRGFFLRERLKQEGRKSDWAPKRVHVVGAGAMGGDIAAWCALNGFAVTLQDLDHARIAPAIARARKLVERQLKESHKVTAAMDRLTPDVAGAGAARCDLAIEAIVEDGEAKKALYKQLEPRLPDGALLATNTSAIELEDLAQALATPERLVGLHFFNPVAKMPLVEIVQGQATSDASLAAGAHFAQAIDKLPLPVGSAAGFLVNRALMPYLLEAVTILGEGQYSRLEIDEAAQAFGMPMGPLHLADYVGLDVCLAVGERLAPETGITLPAQLREMVDQGNKGMKTGQGFYSYKAGEPQVSKRERGEIKGTEPDPELVDRLILPMVNAVVGCRRRGVVADDDLADAGMLFGTGFAPFRGGPLAYARQRGWAECRRRLGELAQSYGDHLAPDAGWQGSAATDSTAAERSAG